MRERLISWSLVIVLIIGQMIRIPIGIEGLQLIDFLISIQFLFIIYDVITPRGGNNTLSIKSYLYWPLALTIVLCLISLTFGFFYMAKDLIGFGDVIKATYSNIRFVYPILLAGYIMSLSGSRDDIKACINLLLGAGLLVTIFGIFQSIFIENFALRYGPEYDWDWQGNRLVSIFLDPNLASSFFSCLFILAISFLLENSRDRKKVLIIITVLSLMAFILTMSRGGFIGLVFGMFFWLYLYRKDVKISAGILLKILLFLLISFWLVRLIFDVSFFENNDRFGVSNDSAINRLVNWTTLFGIFIDSPLLGSGFNYSRILNPVSFVGVSGSYVDGGIIYLLPSFGVVGLVLFSFALYKLKFKFRWPARIYMPIIMTLLFQSFFTSSIFYPLIICYFSLVLSLFFREKFHKLI